MSGFVFHPAAYTDLEEIWGFIAADSLDAADHVLDEIHVAIRSLVAFPNQGHRRPDLTSRPLLRRSSWLLEKRTPTRSGFPTNPHMRGRGTTAG